MEGKESFGSRGRVKDGLAVVGGQNRDLEEGVEEH